MRNKDESLRRPKKMPRFSDVFTWETSFDSSGGGIHVFRTCRLIKRVGKFEKHAEISEIKFDLLGMFLILDNSGPFCLTTTD